MLNPSQNGAVLVTCLVFLVVLTMLGVTTSRMSGLEERMTGNMRDRSIAMQAADLALRDAERDILGITENGATARNPIVALSGLTGFVANCNQDGADDTADDGLCYNGPAGYSPPVWTTANMLAAPSVAYGRFTGATALTLVSAQPRYVIEGISKQVPGDEPSVYYRITARAQGMNANTVVWLQEVFKP